VIVGRKPTKKLRGDIMTVAVNLSVSSADGIECAQLTCAQHVARLAAGCTSLDIVPRSTGIRGATPPPGS
jgi:hypothetical protein